LVRERGRMVLRGAPPKGRGKFLTIKEKKKKREGGRSPFLHRKELNDETQTRKARGNTFPL